MTTIDITTPHSSVNDQSGDGFEEENFPIDTQTSESSPKHLVIDCSDSAPDQTAMNKETGLGRNVSQLNTPKHKRQKVTKTEDDTTPLADPYPLPKYYRADVESALATGKMTKEERSSFLSTVASSMLVFKLYPSRDDYICVARTIVTKYPFMLCKFLGSVVGWYIHPPPLPISSSNSNPRPHSLTACS